MAGKKQYVVEDETGLTWVVAKGDPAYGAVLKCASKRLTVVLPFQVLQTGSLAGVNVTRYRERLDRLSRYYAKEDEDEALAQMTVRYVALVTCLDHLLTIKEEE